MHKKRRIIIISSVVRCWAISLDSGQLILLSWMCFFQKRISFIFILYLNYSAKFAVHICTGRGWTGFNKQIQGPPWAMENAMMAPRCPKLRTTPSFRQTRNIAIDFSEQLFQGFVAWVGWSSRDTLDLHGQNWSFVIGVNKKVFIHVPTIREVRLASPRWAS